MSVFGYGNFDVIADGHVDRKIVQDMIDETLEIKKQNGEIDEVRQYSSFDYFPGESLNPNEVPVTDVQYIAMDSKVEYNWVVDNSLRGGHYEMINEIINKEDLHKMFEDKNSTIPEEDLSMIVGKSGRPNIK